MAEEPKAPPFHDVELNPEEHRKRHVILHQHLDELVACYINTTKFYPSKTVVYDLLHWSYEQGLTPKAKAVHKSQLLTPAAKKKKN